MTEYTESFAKFILSCKASYEDLVEKIENGDVVAGQMAKVTIEIPALDVDRIRLERLAIASANG